MDAKDCFATAASLLQQATKCEPSVAADIVEAIALGTIRWQAENKQPEPPTKGQGYTGGHPWQYDRRDRH